MGDTRKSACTTENTNAYLSVKEEEIHRSRQRARFMNNGENIRIPKPPKPFRELSLPRDGNSQGQNCNNCRKISAPSQYGFRNSEHVDSTGLEFGTVKSWLQTANVSPAQKTELGILLFNLMPQDMAREVVAQQVSVMAGKQLAEVL